MTKGFRNLTLLLCLFLLTSCGRTWQNYWLAARDKEIQKATRALETADGKNEQAELLSKRAHAYSEKARYARGFKLIGMREYEPLFKLALQDHDQAIALAPANAKHYLNRGMSYYFRAISLDDWDKDPQIFFNAANADFKKTVELNPQNSQAHDMKGIVDLHDKNYGEAIADFTRVMELDPKLGRMRLAETYCTRGLENLHAKKTGEAIADFEKSTALEAASDGCDCDPYNPLLGLYLEKGERAKGRTIADKAKASRKWVSPEFKKQLAGN